MEDRYAFITEWLDPQAELIRKYIFTFFPKDNSIEMYDVKNQRTFLKRIVYKEISLNELYLSGKVTVHSRHLTIVDYADVYTKNLFENNKSSCIVVVHGPDYIRTGGAALQHFLDKKLVVAKMEMMQLNSKVITDYNSISGNPLNSTNVIVMQVVGEGCLEVCHSLQGNSKSIFCSPSSCSSNKENQLFFETPRVSTALLDGSALVLVKPHLLQNSGNVIEFLCQNGVEISALKFFSINKQSSAEFLEVYKNVLPEFSSLVSELCSGMLLALEVKKGKASNTPVQDIRDIIGPIDPQIATLLRPKTLRAQFGVDRVRNAVHVTDLEEDGLLECEYFFKILFGDGLTNPMRV